MKLSTCQRNRAFLDLCRSQIAATPASLPIRTAAFSVRAAELMPPMPYALSFGYALRQLRRLRSGAMPPARRPRWEHLDRRVGRLQQRHGLSDREALQRELTDGLDSSRPLSAAYAVRLSQRLRRPVR